MKKSAAFLLVFAILIQTFCFSLCYAEIDGSVSGGGTSLVPYINKHFRTPYGATVEITYDGYTNKFDINMYDYCSRNTSKIYTAIYKKDILQTVFEDTYVEENTQSDDFIVSHDFSTGAVESLSDYTIKFFVWDENLRPLREAYNPTGYESAMLGKITASDGEESVTLLSDTGEILTLEMAEKYVIYDGDYTYSSLEKFKDEYSINALLGTYIYYNLNQGKIDKIFTIDDDYKGTNISFNRDFPYSGPNLGPSPIDKDSVLFFLEYNDDGSINFEQSTVGTVADLSEDLCYTLVSYSKGYSRPNRIIIKKVETPYIPDVPDPDAISVITEVAIGLNNKREPIYYISYYREGWLFGDIPTTNEVTNIKDLTVGDIVNFEMNDGVITNINKRVDLDESIRDNVTGLISATTLASGDSTYTDDTQSYTYGYPTDYYSNSTTAKINDKSYNLMLADYIYIVDDSFRRPIIELGTTDDYDWNWDENYSDWLFVREHEGSIKEVVIIKNVLDIR